MKVFKKIAATLLVAVFAVTVFSTAVFADGTVTYAGSADKFVFEPGSDYTPSDLFDNFKDVMPGDSLTEKITVNNKASNEVKVKIYLRAIGAEEGYEDFLSKLDLTVDQAGSSNLFKATADQTAGLTDWVCLGTLYSGGKVDLNLTLNVPAELGNEYQNALGILDWQFKVEEFPIEKDDPKPVTGDQNDMTVWYVLIAVAAVAICGCVFVLMKKRKDGSAE